MDLSFLIQAISEYRYLAMFGILFISAMGVPIPEEPLLIASGLSVGWGNSQYHLAVAACLAGILAGDLWVYFLGTGTKMKMTGIIRVGYGSRR